MSLFSSIWCLTCLVVPGNPSGTAPVEVSQPQLVVRVVHVSPAGNLSELVGHEVILEGWAMATGSEADLVEARLGVTDGEGVVRFGELAASAANHWRPGLVYDGISFQGEEIARSQTGRQIELRVYDRASSRAALSVSIQGTVEVQEANLLVDQVIILENAGRTLIDLGEDGVTGLRLPLLLPALGDDVIPQGLIPEDTGSRPLFVDQVPEVGRVLFAKGALWYAGPVFPGKQQRVSVRYLLPIVAEAVDLGLSSQVEISQAAFAAVWRDRIRPRVVPNRPFNLLERDVG